MTRRATRRGALLALALLSLSLGGCARGCKSPRPPIHINPNMDWQPRYEAQEGSVYTQSETLLGRYEALLGRKRPLLTDYRQILARLRRYSLIETGAEAEDGLPALRILPTIRLVTGERVQQRLAAFLEKKQISSLLEDLIQF